MSAMRTIREVVVRQRKLTKREQHCEECGKYLYGWSNYPGRAYCPESEGGCGWRGVRRGWRVCEVCGDSGYYRCSNPPCDGGHVWVGFPASSAAAREEGEAR